MNDTALDDATRELVADLGYIALYARHLGNTILDGKLLDVTDATLAARMNDLAAKAVRGIEQRRAF